MKQYTWRSGITNKNITCWRTPRVNTTNIDEHVFPFWKRIVWSASRRHSMRQARSVIVWPPTYSLMNCTLRIRKNIYFHNVDVLAARFAMTPSDNVATKRFFLFVSFQFWNIVPLEQLLAQLEVEQSAAVIRRLVKLLVNSFHPTNKSVDVQVS